MGTELTIAREGWDEFWPEAQLLLAAHHEELDPGSPFAVNESLARALDAAGGLSIHSARTPGGALVGYCIWYLAPGLDAPYLCATQGPWYVLPEWRGSAIALKLFRVSLDSLRASGVARAFPHHWTRGGGERLGEFFRRLGAEPMEVSYSLWLEGAH